jgi:hypothetical protein
MKKSVRRMSPKERLAAYRQKAAGQYNVARDLMSLVKEDGRVAGVEATSRLLLAQGMVSPGQDVEVRRAVRQLKRRRG